MPVFLNFALTDSFLGFKIFYQILYIYIYTHTCVCACNKCIYYIYICIYMNYKYVTHICNIYLHILCPGNQWYIISVILGFVLRDII